MKYFQKKKKKKKKIKIFFFVREPYREIAKMSGRPSSTAAAKKYPERLYVKGVVSSFRRYVLRLGLFTERERRRGEGGAAYAAGRGFAAAAALLPGHVAVSLHRLRELVLQRATPLLFFCAPAVVAVCAP